MEQEWEVTVSITRTLTYPVEDGENVNIFKDWAYSLDGKKCIQEEFIKNLKCYPYKANADIEILDVILKDNNRR